MFFLIGLIKLLHGKICLNKAINKKTMKIPNQMNVLIDEMTKEQAVVWCISLRLDYLSWTKELCGNPDSWQNRLQCLAIS